ncbi:hypothetical protein D3C85_1200630 [compost metagenome]
MTPLFLALALFQSSPEGASSSGARELARAERQGDELCEAVGRASVDLQAVERQARVTAGGSMMLQGVLERLEGASADERAALSDLAKGFGDDVESQFSNAEAMRAVIMRLAVSARQWCGA